nr:septal ring lytic transglycosylase RlpA family protein [Desulfonispora thiosulfatigenes]
MLVPVRSFYDFFGSEIKWQPDDSSTVISYEDKNIQISNLSNEVTINGINQKTCVPTKLVDGKMYIDLEFAASSLGYEATWVENTNTIIATKSDASIAQLENFKRAQACTEEKEDKVIEKTVLEPKVIYHETGTASWYGGSHHGGCTSSGERFNQYEYTAAHKTLPFGTVVKVTSLNTGKCVNVRINDRGPFSRNRVIDLSMASAEAIGLKSAGLGPVKLEIIE